MRFLEKGGKYGAGQVPLPVCVSVCQCAPKGSGSTCLRGLALSLWEYLLPCCFVILWISRGGGRKRVKNCGSARKEKKK